MHPKSKRGAVRQYDAIMRRVRRSLAGGLQFGLDWPTFRLTFPEDYKRICRIREIFSNLPD